MCHPECFSSWCLPLLCTDTTELSTTVVKEPLHITTVLKYLVPWYTPPVPLSVRQTVVLRRGVTHSRDCSWVSWKSQQQIDLKMFPREQIFWRWRMLVRTMLVGGGCSLIKVDVLVFSSEGWIRWDRHQGAVLALGLVSVHLWLRRLCNIKCPAALLGPGVGGDQAVERLLALAGIVWLN